MSIIDLYCPVYIVISSNCAVSGRERQSEKSHFLTKNKRNPKKHQADLRKNVAKIIEIELEIMEENFRTI